MGVLTLSGRGLQKRKVGRTVRSRREKPLVSFLCSVFLAFLRGGAEVKEQHKVEHRFERLPCAGRKAELENVGLKMDDDACHHVIWLLWNEVEPLDSRLRSGPLISCTLSPCSKGSGLVKNRSTAERGEGHRSELFTLAWDAVEVVTHETFTFFQIW